MPNPETSPDARPLRSLLYMPASNRRAIDKARGLDTDAVALDLEDAVAPEMKAEARAALLEELAAGGFGHRRLIARINALDTPWGHDDLAALAAAPVEAVLVPKVDDADDVIALSRAMDAAGYAPGVKLWVMIETPRAVLALERIAACAATTRLAAFVLGLNDLAKDSGMAQLPGRAVFLPVLTLAVLAARAHGLAILDGVCNAIDDSARLEAECVQARDGGFDGKTLIHPAQLAVANRVFAPAEDAIAEAQAIVAAFADPANAGRGALRVNGKMAELLHRTQAERLLEKAAAIAAR
ncbi:HpcH/HpaI aldolase/citrate lyase family protein [Novosphingobium sp. UBA1939]|jgi:citrate lyase subunit beta/citryl-CoA lyase|uniref:HpcH/HpaI aldolase/citrate lyase family protein n=1 Tax=Novosphingobium sp. UBA1939 TaxID=1946982 RepID=UPI0025D7E3C0|nr:CoA ester lyase [Novosphingobium sp. UBA1939]